MSKNELLEYSQLQNIDVARSQLCAVLESAGSSLVRQLNQGPQTLVGHLEKHTELLNALSDGPQDINPKKPQDSVKKETEGSE